MMWTKGAHQSTDFFQTNFRLSTALGKFHQIFTLIGSLKYIKVLLRSTEALYLMTLKIDTKLEEKLICFKNDKDLVKFDLSTQKSPKLALSLAPFVQSI